MAVIKMPVLQPEDGLLERIGRGDREAFLALYRLTSQTVYAYALSLLRNPADAEDATQDTFLKIRSAAHLYKDRGKPMAWIFTVTRNVCRMQQRQAARQQLTGEVRTDSMEQTEQRLLLQQVMQVLSPEEARIILLHAVSGRKHREIAEMLELPLSTVLSKYRRGLQKLQKKMEEEP